MAMARVPGAQVSARLSLQLVLLPKHLQWTRLVRLKTPGRSAGGWGRSWDTRSRGPKTPGILRIQVPSLANSGSSLGYKLAVEINHRNTPPLRFIDLVPKDPLIRWIK